MDLLIATGNSEKFREIQVILRSLPIKVLSLNEFPNILPVDEIGRTYEENAVIKAFSYSKQTGLCALADDSGLEVDILYGVPGVFSARYAGANASDTDRINKLLGELSHQSDTSRSAHFVCSMALVEPSRLPSADPVLLKVSEGRCEGFIARAPRGTNGFGFDPVFVPVGYDLTFAELPAGIKAKISHRAIALDAMRAFLERHLGKLDRDLGRP